MRTRQQLLQAPEPVQVEGCRFSILQEDHTKEDVIEETIEETCQGE